MQLVELLPDVSFTATLAIEMGNSIFRNAGIVVPDASTTVALEICAIPHGGSQRSPAPFTGNPACAILPPPPCNWIFAERCIRAWPRAWLPAENPSVSAPGL